MKIEKKTKGMNETPLKGINANSLIKVHFQHENEHENEKSSQNIKNNSTFSSM